MIQIFVNQTNFDGNWAAETLYSLFNVNQKVLIIPLTENNGYASDQMAWRNQFSENSEHYEDVIRPFIRYGIPRKNIKIFDIFDDYRENLKSYIQSFDIVCLVGEDELGCYSTLLDYNFNSLLKDYEGILIAIGAAATPLTESFPSYDDELGYYAQYSGLGFLKGIDLVMNYVQSDELLQYISNAIEMRNQKVLVCPKNSGILLTDTSTELFGEAFIADQKDLDEIYNLMK